jgi:Mn2+/Fe2+ NRAMP family transporter
VINQEMGEQDVIKLQRKMLWSSVPVVASACACSAAGLMLANDLASSCFHKFLHVTNYCTVLDAMVPNMLHSFALMQGGVA